MRETRKAATKVGSEATKITPLQKELGKAYDALIGDLKALLETRDDLKTFTQWGVREGWQPSTVSNIRIQTLRDAKLPYVDHTKVFDPANFVFDQGGNRSIPLLDAVVSPFRSLIGPPKTVDQEKVFDLFRKHLGLLATTQYALFAPTRIYKHEDPRPRPGQSDWADQLVAVPAPKPIVRKSTGAAHSPDQTKTQVNRPPKAPSPEVEPQLGLRVQRIPATSSGIVGYLEIYRSSANFEKHGFPVGGPYALIVDPSSEGGGEEVLRFKSDDRHKLGFLVTREGKDEYRLVESGALKPTFPSEGDGS